MHFYEIPDEELVCGKGQRSVVSQMQRRIIILQYLTRTDELPEKFIICAEFLLEVAFLSTHINTCEECRRQLMLALAQTDEQREYLRTIVEGRLDTDDSVSTVLYKVHGPIPTFTEPMIAMAEDVIETFPESPLTEKLGNWIQSLRAALKF